MLQSIGISYEFMEYAGYGFMIYTRESSCCMNLEYEMIRMQQLTKMRRYEKH